MKDVVSNNAPCRPWQASSSETTLRGSLAKDWIQRAVWDVGMLNATMLISCQSLCTIRRRDSYCVLAMQYRSKCFQGLAGDLASKDPGVNELTIAKAFVLLCDSVCVSELPRCHPATDACRSCHTIQRQQKHICKQSAK